MRRRTRARELAVQFLYQLDLRGDEVATELAAFMDTAEVGEDDVDQRRRPQARDREVKEFALRLIEGTRQHRAEADRILSRVTRNWDIGRMAAVDRNILRMAIYELLHCPDIPPKVTINEAIELGKRFSTANSGAFINGLLDRIRIDLESGALAHGEPQPGGDTAALQQGA